jgi:hypothetical protein
VKTRFSGIACYLFGRESESSPALWGLWPPIPSIKSPFECLRIARLTAVMRVKSLWRGLHAPRLAHGRHLGRVSSARELQ